MISAQERFSAQPVTLENDANLDDAAEQWAEFDTFRDQAGGAEQGFVIWVYRIVTDTAGNPQSGAPSSLLFNAPIDRYTLPQIFDRVKAEYMPAGYGTATIRVMLRKGQERGVKWQKLFIIEKSAREGASEKSSDPNAGTLAALVQEMARQNREMMNFLQQRANAPAPVSVVDPVQQAIQLVGAMSGMMGALVQKAAAPGPATSGIGDMITGVREMMKLTRELGSGNDGGDVGGDDASGALGVIKAIGPIADVVKELIVSARQNPPAPAPRQLAGPSIPPALPPRAAPVVRPEPAAVPAAATRPEVVTTEIPEGDNAMLGKVSEILGDLVKLAENGSDPAALGATVADLLPAEYADKFLVILDSENWFAKLAAFNPAVKTQPEWFAQLRTSILAEYVDDTEPTPGA